MSAWTQVTAVLAEEPEDWSVWAELFERHGLPGTLQTDDPPTMSAYLPPGGEAGLEPLRDVLLERGAVRVETALVEEEDWAESWKQFFKPRRVGERFVVRPTWEEFAAEPGDLVVVLDPGQAFGTGDHPTTRMCMECLEQLPVAGSEVADVGCGSGILAVAAMMLGARSVDAVDSDLPAVEATGENAARNAVEVRALLGRGFEPLAPEATYDLVLSNIISAALIALAPEAGQRVRPGGHWVVSGVIESNWPDVRAAAERAGFRLVEARQELEWVAATFVR